MAERKVLNKYIPPDFDPSKIPRLRLGKDRQIKVRLMSPFSMRCDTCGQWIGKGTKFNARKEPVQGEKFHTIQIFRFYIRCQRCAAEITFKTDPENLNYQVEKGAQRNFEPWRDEKALNEEIQLKREEEEENNPIKALENRTEESRREMEILDALDEIRMKNSADERVDAQSIIDAIHSHESSDHRRAKEVEDAEDERIAKSVFTSASGARVKRAREEDAVRRERNLKAAAVAATLNAKKLKSSGADGSGGGFSCASLGIKKIVPSKSGASSVNAESAERDEKDDRPTATLSALLGSYGDGSDSENSSDDE